MPFEHLTTSQGVSVETFQSLRAGTGWGVPEAEACRTAIDNSLLSLTAYAGTAPVGMVRVVGDGVLNAYVQDLIVEEDCRGKGVGRHLMDAALANLAESCPSSLSIGLVSAHGMDGFYEALGFRSRPNDVEGAGFQSQLGELLTTSERHALAKPGRAE